MNTTSILVFCYRSKTKNVFFGWLNIVFIWGWGNRSTLWTSAKVLPFIPISKKYKKPFKVKLQFSPNSLKYSIVERDFLYLLTKHSKWRPLALVFLESKRGAASLIARYKEQRLGNIKRGISLRSLWHFNNGFRNWFLIF